VQALVKCELLMLMIEDIDKMKIEFPDVFEELFTNSYRRLKKELQLKIEAIKLCEKSRNTSNLRSMRASNILDAMERIRTSQII
jgi:hypothetical protein